MPKQGLSSEAWYPGGYPESGVSARKLPYPPLAYEKLADH
jgi:hypothetical protein